jgi:DNA-directed RNA polymerase subunit RPC12/RpoP
LKCPSCRGFLIFIDGKKAAETGNCPHCSARVFDERMK